MFFAGRRVSSRRFARGESRAVDFGPELWIRDGVRVLGLFRPQLPVFGEKVQANSFQRLKAVAASENILKEAADILERETPFHGFAAPGLP